MSVGRAEKVDQLAERLGRAKGSIIKKALTSFVAREEERHRLTLEALADAVANRTTNHARIEAWAEGLGKPKRRRRRR